MTKRERILIDTDSEIKKARGFILGYVTASGKVEFIHYVEHLNGAERSGLGSDMKNFVDVSYHSGRDFTELKNYDTPKPGE